MAVQQVACGRVERDDGSIRVRREVLCQRSGRSAGIAMLVNSPLIVEHLDTSPCFTLSWSATACRGGSISVAGFGVGASGAWLKVRALPG